LIKKIEIAQEHDLIIAQNKKEEKEATGPSTASMVTKSVLKVVTSASFIRGAFGVLMKMFKK
jgi:hypothetical protein